MKLTDVIAVWDILRAEDSSDVGFCNLDFCDLEKAIDKVVGVKNDICVNTPVHQHICQHQDRHDKLLVKRATIVELLAELTTRFEGIKTCDVIVPRQQ